MRFNVDSLSLLFGKFNVSILNLLFNIAIPGPGKFNFAIILFGEV